MNCYYYYYYFVVVVLFVVVYDKIFKLKIKHAVYMVDLHFIRLTYI